MVRVELGSRAEKDLRKLDRSARTRIEKALERLAAGEDLDVRPLVGRTAWWRLRTGDYRVIYRPIGDDEEVDAEILVARVVDRRDLRRAVKTL